MYTTKQVNNNSEESYFNDWKLSAEEQQSKWRHNRAVVNVDLHINRHISTSKYGRNFRCSTHSHFMLKHSFIEHVSKLSINQTVYIWLRSTDSLRARELNYKTSINTPEQSWASDDRQTTVMERNAHLRSPTWDEY